MATVPLSPALRMASSKPRWVMCFMNVREVEFWKITGQIRPAIQTSLMENQRGQNYMRGHSTLRERLWPFGCKETFHVTAHPPSRAEPDNVCLPTHPVAGERVGRHGAIEPSG